MQNPETNTHSIDTPIPNINPTTLAPMLENSNIDVTGKVYGQID